MADGAFRFPMHFGGDMFLSKSSHAVRLVHLGREMGFNNFVQSGAANQFFPFVSVIEVAPGARIIGAIEHIVNRFTSPNAA